MLAQIRDLLKVNNFGLHFGFTSLIFCYLPTLIFRLYDAHSNEYLLHGHQWYLNFDGIHYFYNLYQYQPNHAFLPLFVKFVQMAKGFIGESWAILALIVVNKIAFLVAACDLKAILGNLTNDYQSVPGEEEGKEKVNNKIVKIGMLMFLYNPAGIFFNVVYTQCFFCLLTFKAVRLLLQNKSTFISIVLMASSVAIRSNGMFLAPVIGLQILTTFFTSLKSKLMTSIKAVVKGTSIILLLLAPFVAHNIFTYLNICEYANHSSSLCDGSFMNFYGSVQQKYWNVGFLKYFHLGNIVFIIIGTPAVLLAILGLSSYSARFNLRQKGLFLSFVILLVITTCFTNIQSSTRFFCSHPFFYYILATLSNYRILGRIVGIWVIFYWLTGIFMYVVSFPWT